MDRFGNVSALILILLVALIPAILFIITMQKTLNAITPHNRKMPPGASWLLLLPIPILGNIIWLIVPYKFSQSIENELKERGITSAKNPTLFAGLAVGITSLLAYIPFMQGYTKYAWFIFFFFYWYKVSEYKRKLTGQSSQAIQ